MTQRAATLVRCAVGPGNPADWLAKAIADGGGRLVDIVDAEVLLWSTGPPSQLREAVASAPLLRWVGLLSSGADAYRECLDDRRAWTSAKGVFGPLVAEHALALSLAGLRSIARMSHHPRWDSDTPTATLHGARVVVVGGGGIAAALLELLKPFDARTVVVRRDGPPLPGASLTVKATALDDVLPDADLVVLAAALTPSTAGLFGTRRLALLATRTWLVNVGRGGLVDTEALVDALRRRSIGGAALDVTDPEPLPQGHPLWSMDNCIITPHIGVLGAPHSVHESLLSQHVTDNLGRFAKGLPLAGRIDISLAY